MGYKKTKTKGREKGRKNLVYTDEGILNQKGVLFTPEEKKALENAVRTANRKANEYQKIFDTLPYKIEGKETGATVGEMRVLGKEADFSITKKTASLQRFTSHDEYDRYMKNLNRVNSKDFMVERARQYKRNYTRALTDPENGLGLAYDEVSDILMKIRTMKPEDYIRNVASNEELEIHYLYDDGNGSIDQKLNAIRSALGLKHRDHDTFWEGDEFE